MQQYECKYFTLKFDGIGLNIVFEKKTCANTFARMYFYSGLLNSFKPNADAVWIPQKRLDVEIKGWSKNVSWNRTSDTIFEGNIADDVKLEFQDFSKVLESAIGNVFDGVSIDGDKYYAFAIGNNLKWQEYLFKTRSRSICALCVLYDLKSHTRNELEVRISEQYKPKIRPSKVTGEEAISKFYSDKSNKTVSRFYGDPSKTVDEMRNEGWTREGDNPSLIVKGGRGQGSTQQTYKLTSTKQNLSLQVARTTILQRWKTELFIMDDYTCKLCHTRHDNPRLLAPDHRVPVVIQADMLTEENYKDKLMTLCVSCNQRKREFTKKVTLDYDWNSSPWAYPEKFQLEKIEEDISRYSQANQKSFDDVIQDVKRIHENKN
ncbi:MAG: hypothetical protein AAGE84_17155 [Cyanobacteria bacterium P01_G01_bin.39]